MGESNRVVGHRFVCHIQFICLPSNEIQLNMRYKWIVILAFIFRCVALVSTNLCWLKGISSESSMRNARMPWRNAKLRNTQNINSSIARSLTHSLSAAQIHFTSFFFFFCRLCWLHILCCCWQTVSIRLIWDYCTRLYAFYVFIWFRCVFANGDKVENF